MECSEYLNGSKSTRTSFNLYVQYFVIPLLLLINMSSGSSTRCGLAIDTAPGYDSTLNLPKRF